jgi:hypothetical protein
MYDGRTPFVNPSPSLLWEHILAVCESRYQEAVTNKTIFQTWVASQVLRGDQSDTCSDAIVVYPQSVGETLYRNLYTSQGSSANDAPNCWNSSDNRAPVKYKKYSFSGLAVYNVTIAMKGHSDHLLQLGPQMLCFNFKHRYRGTDNIRKSYGTNTKALEGIVCKRIGCETLFHEETQRE